MKEQSCEKSYMSHERLSSAVGWYHVHEPTCGWSGSPADWTWSLPGSAAGQQCSSLSSCVSSRDPLLQTPHLKDSPQILGPACNSHGDTMKRNRHLTKRIFCRMSWSAEAMTTKHQWQPTEKRWKQNDPLLTNGKTYDDSASRPAPHAVLFWGGWGGNQPTTIFNKKEGLQAALYAYFFKWQH